MSVLDKFFPDPSVVEPRHKSKPTFSDRTGLGQIADILNNDPTYNNENDVQGDSGCNRPIIINLTINMPSGESTNNQIVIPASVEDKGSK